MIKLLVDEAYAFDYYSIFELKTTKNQNLVDSMNQIKIDLISQIGEEKFKEIINSEEYRKLYDANSETFDAVDKAKTDEVLASHVDKCNYLRMLAKKDLQNKFFTNKLTEFKIGYEKLKIENE